MERGNNFEHRQGDESVVETNASARREDEIFYSDAQEIAYATEKRLAEIRKEIEKQNLPVRERQAELRGALQDMFNSKDGILLFCGETGSGKSVYAPEILLQELKKAGLKESVVVMEPRRDAARMVSEACASIANRKFGSEVGFSTSEHRGVTPTTKISFLTSGIFLRRLAQGELSKEKVGALVIDEIHEGSLEYHFVLGLIKLAKEQNNLPPTVLMSATFDREKFSEFLGIDKSAYLKIEGRTHPVSVDYAGFVQQEYNKSQYIKKTALATVEKFKYSNDNGDVLVFLPGIREIEKAVEIISEELKNEHLEILSLHGSMSPEDRAYVLNKPTFAPRRIIVSTDLAETSLTVPGITLVVDSLMKHAMVYDPESGIRKKTTERISKMQAKQRAGRAGRVKPGQVIRVIDESDYEMLPEHPVSQINRENLSQVYLQVLGLGLEPETFPFIESPKEKLLKAAKDELLGLGAINESGQITEIGIRLSELPFEPRVGIMVLESEKRNVGEAGLVMAAFTRENKIVSMMSQAEMEKNWPQFSKNDQRILARKLIKEKQKKFEYKGSDWIKLLNIFTESVRQGVFDINWKSKNPEDVEAAQKFTAWCKSYYLNPGALTHIAFRLKDYAYHAGVNLKTENLAEILENSPRSELSMVILSGFGDQLIFGNNEYRKAFELSESMMLSPGSDSFTQNAFETKFFVSGEITEGKINNKYNTDAKMYYAQMLHPVSEEELKIKYPKNITTEKVENITSPLYKVVKTQTFFETKFVKTLLSSTTEDVVTDNPEIKALAEDVNELLIRTRKTAKAFDLKYGYSFEPIYNSIISGFREVMELLDFTSNYSFKYANLSYGQRKDMAVRTLERIEQQIKTQEALAEEVKRLQTEYKAKREAVSVKISQLGKNIAEYGLSDRDYTTFKERFKLANTDTEDLMRESKWVSVNEAEGLKSSIERLNRLVSDLENIHPVKLIFTSEQKHQLEAYRKNISEMVETGWSPALKAALKERVLYLDSLKNLILANMSPEKPEKEIKIKTKLSSIGAYFKEVDTVIQREQVTAKSFYGGFTNQESAMKRSFSEWANFKFEGKLDKDWQQLHEYLWYNSEQVVLENPTAVEYIEGGLIEKEYLVEKLRDYVNSQLENLMQGKSLGIDLQKELERILNNY